jgi:hypothetical protein
MSMTRAPEEHSPRLPPGTQVGEWRVVDWQGQGAYGTVYRALRLGQEESGPVALKLAVYPWDRRFAREAELLSRIHHPNVPRLLGQGLLRYASGTEHPYLVMEWVEGMPLYAWAKQHAPSSSQLLLLLAQVARTLAAIHAANAVHRDVKGDNILVRHSDGRALLIDFGSGQFQGAPRLTWQSLPPLTPAYRSAQACLFHILSVRDRDAYYEATPADDIFALGVTAYRLVMGEYPPPMEPHEDETGAWRVTSPDPRPLLEQNPRVEPHVRELILRMLAPSPEARGTAEALAEALEAAAAERPRVRLTDSPQAAKAAEVAPPKAVTPAGEEGRPEPRARGLTWAPWLALTAAGVVAVLLWTARPAHVPPVHVSVSTRRASHSQAPDAGTAAVGNSTPKTPQAAAQPPAEKKPIAQDPPPEPRPGQTRPDEKGRCPGRTQVLINKGCWVEHPSMTAEACRENGYTLLKGRCYTPALAPPRVPVPTSNPSEAP